MTADRPRRDAHRAPSTLPAAKTRRSSTLPLLSTTGAVGQPARPSVDGNPKALRALRELARVLLEGVESDFDASLVEALRVLDRLRDRHAILVWPHLSAEDLLAPLVHAHAVGQIGEFARLCLAAGDSVPQQLERLTLNRGLVVCVLGDQPGVVSAPLSNE